MNFDFRIGPYHFHNKEQMDLKIKPLLCIHKLSDGGSESMRIFIAVFFNRFQPWGIERLFSVRWKKRGTKGVKS